MEDTLWRKVYSNILKGRWWFFWNFVIKGKSMQVSLWANSGDVMAEIHPNTVTLSIDEVKAESL